MARICTVLALFFHFAANAGAQDMPLSQILIDGAGWKKVEKPGAKPPPLAMATYMTLSADRGTAFVCVPKGASFLDVATVVDEAVSVQAFRPYAPLRTRRGETGIDVGGLATDRDGRIYAATEIGVQVFDPTGRLCGVLTPAAPGKPEAMTFEGDTLMMWIGEAKYARKLRTEGKR